MRGLTLAISIAPFGLLTQTGFAQDEANLVRWYDVRALDTLHVEDRGVDVRLHLDSSFLDNLEPDGYDVEVEDSFSPDDYDWSQLILDALGEDWPDDQVYVDERGGMLRIEGKAATHDEVGRILSQLTERLLGTVRVEYFALRPSDVPTTLGSVLSAAEVESLLGSAQVLDYAGESVFLGRRSRLGRAGSRSIVMDYDVEVAQHARTADPAVTILREGSELGVLPLARDEGGFFLRVWGRRGQLPEAVRQVKLDSLGGVPIELPTMLTTLAVSSANVPDGGGLLVGTDWTANGVWLVRATAETARATDGPFVSLAELTARPLFIARPRTQPASPSGGFPEFEDDFAHQLDDDLREPAFAEDDLIDRLWEERESKALGGSFLHLGGDLYVRGSDRLLQHTRASVSELRRAIVGPTIEVDLRLGVLDRGVALELIRARNETGLLELLDRRLLGSARAGDTLVVVGGQESFYLQDHDVEIAQAAAIADPIIANVFDGVSFWCLPSRIGDGRLSLLVELDVLRHSGERRSVSAMVWEPRDPSDSSEDNIPKGGFEDSALIELPSTARAGVRSQVGVQEGAWKLLTCSGFGGEATMLVAMVRATAAR